MPMYDCKCNNDECNQKDVVVERLIFNKEETKCETCGQEVERLVSVPAKNLQRGLH